jgi:hypothetical protein
MRSSGKIGFTKRETLWLLGYPKTALMETDHAIAAARETDHMPTLLFALALTALTHICSRDHVAAAMHLEECIPLAQEKRRCT